MPGGLFAYDSMAGGRCYLFHSFKCRGFAVGVQALARPKIVFNDEHRPRVVVVAPCVVRAGIHVFPEHACRQSPCLGVIRPFLLGDVVLLVYVLVLAYVEFSVRCEIPVMVVVTPCSYEVPRLCVQVAAVAFAVE